MRYIILITTLAISLAACQRPDDKPPVKLFEDQTKALDKAKAVEKDLQKAADEQRKVIDAQTVAPEGK